MGEKSRESKPRAQPAQEEMRERRFSPYFLRLPPESEGFTTETIEHVLVRPWGEKIYDDEVLVTGCNCRPPVREPE